MKAVQVSGPGKDFEVVEKPTPEPGEYDVLIKVEACGVCHSDMFVKEGAFPGIEYPRIPGHEVVGIVDKVGSRITHFNPGDRVGVGWHGGHCFQCNSCRDGDFINCEQAKICGISYDGGYAEYMVAPHEAVARIPDGLKSEEAAPILCAGITVFNAMRNAGVRPGDVCAIQGVGGLGHLAIQYANKMGLHTVAISTSDDKKELAEKLGAHQYINAKKENPVEELQKLGGANLIVATAPNSEAISSVVDGLGANGKLMVAGASADPMQISPFQLIMGKRQIAGWSSGTAKDSEDTLNFSALTQSLPIIETYPLEQAAEAYDRMMTNQARFRTVIVP